jgi:pyruvate dehydrogenase E2 component (dihydrolipoyllysine-residue acetyltransferase)
MTAVTVPDIGDFDDVPVIEILVAPGDSVSAEDPLVTLESDKATMDVPSPSAGTVAKVLVKVGDRVSEGTPIVMLEGDDDSTPPSPAVSPSAPAPAETPPRDGVGESPAPSNSSGNGDSPVYASPSIRRLARELGVDLQIVSGTGRKGRITAEDVRGGTGSSGVAGGGPLAPTVSAALPGIAPWPTVDFEKFGPIERVSRSRIQKISAPILARNWVMIPHVTQNDEADITELEAWRKQLNAEQDVKVTMVAFLIVACVAALKEFPEFNASLDGEDLVLRKYWNIGFAADTPGGLVVPVIKNADQKGLLEIATELGTLAAKAREGKLGPGEMNGGTFTISSLGGIGGTSFTPIINAPEVAILGVTRSAIKPVWNGSEFVPRLIVPLSLSYDHRVIDGALAARFVVHLTKVLSDLRRALL